MKCERCGGPQDEASQAENRGPVAWWRRLHCEDCRRAHAADRRIERGATQLRDTPAPLDSLVKTLAAVGCSTAHLSAENKRATREALGRALALVGVGIFVTTLAQPDRMGGSLFGAPQFPAATAQRVAGYWALVGLFWYLKPLAALALESVPGLLSRRRLCLLGSALGAALLWLHPSLSVHASGAGSLIVGIGLNALLALASTILGGYLVEQAQRIGASGRLGALHQAASHLAGLAAPLLGLTAGRAIGPTVAAALLAAFGITAALLLPQNSPATSHTSQTMGAGRERAPRGIAEQIRILGGASELWQVALLLLLIVGPSSFEALLTKQQATHGFSPDQRLHLSWVAEAATLASIAAYILVCRKVRLRSLLPAGILANAGGTLLYFAYAGPIGFAAAAAIEVVNGLGAALIVVTLFDLAVRAVPRQCPYLGYAILMSVTNMARALSEVATASLSLGFATVVILSAVCSMFAMLVVTRLPSALVTRREGEPLPGGAQLVRG